MDTITRITAALRTVESQGAVDIWTPKAERDQGRAIGPWQIWPETFAQWYLPQPGDSWPRAMEVAAMRLVAHYTALHREPAEIAQIFHLGYGGWQEKGIDRDYAAKFAAAFAKLSS